METSFRQFAKIISLSFLFIFTIQLYMYGEEKENIHPYKIAYDEVMQLHADPVKVATVTSYMLRRDEATFALSEGKLYLCTPVLDEECAAIFIGQGTFSFTPPTTIEQEQLARFYDKKSVNQQFTMMFMMFSDSTYQEFLSSLTFEPSENTKSADHEIRSCLKHLSDDDGSYFHTDILRTLFEHDHSGLFYAHIEDPEWAFMIDPYAEEEVRLKMENNDVFEKIVQYPLVETTVKNISKERISITGYTLDCTIQDNSTLDFSGVSTMTFTMNDENPKWLDLWLYSSSRRSLVADSVMWMDGKRLTCWSVEENPDVWLKLDSTLHKGEVYSLRIAYHGRALKKIDEYGWIGLEAEGEWFPRYGNRMSSTFDITFHYSSKYKLASIGDCVSSDTKDEVTTSHWISKTPVGYASFNLGIFEEVTLKNDSIPEVELLYSKTGKTELAQLFMEYMILSSGDMEDRIAEEVQQSAKLFYSMFGDYPFKKLYVTQVPYLHGMSFPGLIHISWAAFQFKNELSEKEGWAEVYYAHEVAHQWFGNGVDIQSYHDLWLNEGIADYCGLLFMQQALKDNEKFFDMLTDWKEEILTNRKFLFGSGQQAGPIWLGNRTESSQTGGDYDLIIYKKGAWVLHMLRNMLLDLKTMKEDRFNEILKDFYTTYKGKRASTDDFKQIVEKHVGGKMDWFFDQWVYNTGIPKYKFAYKTEKTEDGKYKVSCKVQTEGVSENFQMFVPLYIDFGNGKYFRMRTVVKGLNTQFDLPLLPMPPEAIKFNDLESVLCEVDDEDWDDIK